MPHRPTYYEILAKRKKYPIRVRDVAWIDYLGDWDQNLIQVITKSKQKHDDHGEENNDYRKERKEYKKGK